MSGPVILERVLWLSGGANLARASCISWDTREFICFPISGLLDPFMPRHHQIVIVADIELVSFVIPAVVWGATGEGIIRIEVTDNSNAMSRMSRKRDKRGIALKLLSAFLKRAINKRLRLAILYSRTYRDVSADALTRNSVNQIEDWATEEGFTWIETPPIWNEFCLSVDPGGLARYCEPICFAPRSDLNMRDVE